jgi:hypothetical protein
MLEGEGEDNIIFPQRTVPLLKIEVALNHMHMALTHILSLIFHKWFMMCNVYEWENLNFL